MITKWYPNREDPQIGVFIQKHAKAISYYNNVNVLYIHSQNNLLKKFEIVQNENGQLNEILIYYRKDTSLLSKIINPVLYLLALSKGIQLLEKKEKKPDIIHAYILTRTGFIAWYLSKRKRIPYIISEQWSGFVTGKYLKKSLLKKSITGFVVRKSKAVTCVSQFLSDRMKNCGLENNLYCVIPNVIETPLTAKSLKHNDAVNVLLVADLVDEIKNISSVIKMINNVEEEITFSLSIIGGGPDESMLKKLASNFNLLDKKVFFLGQKVNEEVYSHLLQSDFLIMNSRYETFSLICAEAMSCGIPVLATRCGGPDEFVTDDTGILIDSDNEELLKNNFIYMLRNFKKFDSHKIKEYAMERFSKEKAGIAFQKLYSTVINQ